VAFVIQIALANASQPKLRPEYTLAATLVLLAVVVIGLAIPVRRSTREGSRHRVDPFYATRVVILGKASALAGALLSGAGLGFLLELFVRSGMPSGDAYLRAGLGLAASVTLLVAGLVAEWLCTVPPDDGDADASPPGSVES
jgi:hypothetical protein